MSGLEQITSRIAAEAASEAKEILAQAATRSKEIIAQAQAERDEYVRERREEIEESLARAVELASSAAESEAKKTILSAKRRLIKEIIEEAKRSCDKMSDKDYFEVVLALAAHCAHEEPGELALSAADCARLPKDFEKKLAERAAGKLTLSKRTAEISRGCVLIYPDSDENCSFEALFKSAEERMSDLLAIELFK